MSEATPLLCGAAAGEKTSPGLIFPSIVSGNDAAQGLIRSTIKGPDYLTGGRFCVDSSVLALLLCIATGIAMLVMAERRGKIVPPIWKRPA
ncbi:MAG: hypothetical protein JNK67_08755 [Alphaproteobacteria bacterium]|nr:hypothetical protein [Alphaproteobacteria bacterium]